MFLPETRMVSVTRKAEQTNSGRKAATKNNATIFVKKIGVAKAVPAVVKQAFDPSHIVFSRNWDGERPVNFLN